MSHPYVACGGEGRAARGRPRGQDKWDERRTISLFTRSCESREDAVTRRSVE